MQMQKNTVQHLPFSRKFLQKLLWEMNERCVVHIHASYYVTRLSPIWIEPSEKAWYVKKALHDKSKTACEATYVRNEKTGKK